MATDTKKVGGTEITEEAKQFGVYLRNLRKAMKYSQADLAGLVDITSGYYGFFEQGRQLPSLKLVNRLADVLKADYLELARQAGYDEEEARDKAVSRRGTFRQDSPDDDEDDRNHRGSADDDADAPIESRTQQQTNTTPISQDKPSSSNVDLGLEHLDGARLDWAMSCITSDPTFKLSDQFTQGVLPVNIKALVIQLYQAQTGRKLLTEQEFQELNHMVHG